MDEENSPPTSFVNANAGTSSNINFARPSSGNTQNDANTAIQQTPAPNVDKTKAMGMSSEEFWKQGSNDFTNNFNKPNSHQSSNKIMPYASATGEMTQQLERIATIQDQNKYDKEKDRDPAVIMAAMNYKKVRSLCNEKTDKPFTYFCSSADTIMNNCNNHPSFRIYFAFLKRFMIVSFIICLLQLCSVVYIYSCDWYEDEDMKFGFELSFLGNSDGVLHLSQGSYGTDIGKDNADTSRDMVMGVDMVATIFLAALLFYQIYISKTELRDRNDPISIRDYAVRVCNIQKGCPSNLEREIQKQFIRFGRVVEIIPVKNYHKALALELEIRKIGEKIGDRRAKDSIRGQNNQGKINELVSTEQKLIASQRKLYTKIDKDLKVEEVIVVFDTVQSRNECIDEYTQYSHWYSCKKLPPNLSLHGSYSYKVKEAPEPFDYNLENIYFPKILNYLIFFSFIAILTTGIMVMYSYMITDLDDKYENLPIYTECDKYYFDVVTTSDYATAINPDEDEVSCFCRNLGYDDIEDDCDGTTNAGCKDLCQYWIDYHEDYYDQFFLVITCMMAINVAVTYGYKIVFHKCIFKTRHDSTRSLLTAVTIFGSLSFFLGMVPEFFLDSDQYDLDRVWYLKAGTIYYSYYIGMLFLHPIETAIFCLLAWMHRKCVRSSKILQKDLNKLIVGYELDYSHKIGRLMAHAWICYYHGVSMPELYLMFFIHIAIFVAIEKLLMLKFYRKLELQGAWIRQFLIHVLYFILICHCFRAIDVLGAEDLFPEGFTEQVAIKNGTLVNYYEPNKRYYLDRMFSISGFGYLLIALALAGNYAFSWWTHRKSLGKLCGFSALLSKPGRNMIPASALKDRRLGYPPCTYNFKLMSKYKDVIQSVEQAISGDYTPDGRVNSGMDSQYDLKSEANSGDDVMSKSKNNPVPNIYNKDAPTLGIHVNNSGDGVARADSEELDEIELH